MFSFIHDISAWLEAILTAISSNFWLSLLFIFLVCIGEAVFILGLLVPSLPILLLTGGLIAQGAQLLEAVDTQQAEGHDHARLLRLSDRPDHGCRGIVTAPQLQ